MKEEYPGYIPQQPEHGGTFHETESPVHYVERPPSETSGVLNNLWPTLTGNATDGYKLIMTLGHVDARKHTGDAALPLAITNIPGQPDPILNALTVVSGDKIFCEILESTTGVATAAEIKKASTWPTSTAADLIGGDDQTGTAGTRNIRLCEIETVDGLVRVKVYHSGNIAHFAPELVENLTTSPGSGEARVLKQWNSSTGKWELRYLKEGAGVKITENASYIEVKVDPDYDFGATASHPWKCTPNGDEFINVAAGCVTGFIPYSDGTYGEANFFLPFVEIYKEYAGGSVEITAATGYLYAVVGVTKDFEGYEGGGGSGTFDIGGELYRPDNTNPTVVFSDATPSSYAPNDANVHILIAKVALDAGVASVTTQILWHNPSIQLDAIFVDVIE